MIKRIKFRTTNNGSLNTTQKSKIKQHEPHEKSVGAPEGRENSWFSTGKWKTKKYNSVETVLESNEIILEIDNSNTYIWYMIAPSHGTSTSI